MNVLPPPEDKGTREIGLGRRRVTRPPTFARQPLRLERPRPPNFGRRWLTNPYKSVRHFLTWLKKHRPTLFWGIAVAAVILFLTGERAYEIFGSVALERIISAFD